MNFFWIIHDSYYQEGDALKTSYYKNHFFVIIKTQFLSKPSNISKISSWSKEKQKKQKFGHNFNY